MMITLPAAARNKFKIFNIKYINILKKNLKKIDELLSE